MVEKPYGSGFRAGESKESGEKLKNEKISWLFKCPNEHELTLECFQIFFWSPARGSSFKSFWRKSALRIYKKSLFHRFVPEDARKSMKMNEKCLRKKFSPLLEIFLEADFEVFLKWVLADEKLPKVVRSIFLVQISQKLAAACGHCQFLRNLD